MNSKTNSPILFLKSVVEGSDSAAGRVFDFSVQSLILLSLLSFAAETLPNLDESAKSRLQIFEVVTVVVFSIEYLLRFCVADQKIKFVTSFYGIIDLLAVLPFYVSLGVDLRSLRAFRFFRLFRMLKLARYNAAIRRFHKAFLIAKEELGLFALATGILLYLSAVGIYYCEHETQPEKFSSVFESLWWAVVTLTTVGYGDSYPITVGGKLFTVFVLFVGLGIVSIPAGLVASALSKARELES